MIRFHCIQHVPFETPGNIQIWAKEKGHSLSYTHIYNNEELPAINDFDVLIIMGGPMSIHDEKEFSWLKREKEFIKAAIQENKKLLGICLGSQLIADALGAKVYNNKEKEIGFMPIDFTEAALKSNWFGGFNTEEIVFHWHGETFDLPEGATLLASTEACRNQAYSVGNNILAFQFHLEVTPGIVKDMVKHEGHELIAADYIHSAEKILSELHYLERNKKILFSLLDKFV
ncbi:MAG TPA: type 1 glutamine amidotransferase [Puia sp.]|nr:type 1 glutamine amidotransferase [Puia sp.]